MEKTLLEKLNLEVIENTYKCMHCVADGMGARSFFGKNLKTDEDIFIKFLLFPRSSFEKSRFQNEICTLEHLSRFPMAVAPKIFARGDFYNEEILYLVTEKISGTVLDSWIKHHLSNSRISDRLEIFHRVASSVSYYAPMYSHRDLHPGNIILLDKKPIWEGRIVEPEVRILDWGHSFGALLAQAEGAPDFMIELLERIPKEVSGSFYSSPPDIFYPFEKAVYNPGKHDAWSLGLLIYKLMTEKDLFKFSSLGEYAESLQKGFLKDISYAASVELAKLDHPASNIISKMFYKLTSSKPEDRMDSATAGRIMWDIRIEGLVIENEYELNNYMNNPHEFRPASGWRYSSWNYYD